MATATVNVRLGRMDTGTAEEPVVRRFTADEAMRMVELGILGDDEHVELLDGVLVEMSPQGRKMLVAAKGRVVQDKQTVDGGEIPEPVTPDAPKNAGR